MRRGLFLLLVSAFVLMCQPLPVQAAASMPVELAKTLKSLAKAGGFSASFTQRIRFSDGSAQRYRGEVDVLTPGRFRWRYVQPFEQLFVSDGFNIWHYEPDLMQVTVLKEMRDVDPAVIRLLDGSIGMNDVHLLEADAAKHRYYVRIGDKTRVWLGVRHAQLAYIESLDVLGNSNRLTLERMQLTAPDAGRFAFVIPDGVDVVPLR
ncbi:MAG: outer-membrane lipoprotein carrier protein LolA [Mariprofundaceae bacterium]|nr:outer-membrane lipoprotein carrier protein LolA [Mariprofundaceae bacterium]